MPFDMRYFLLLPMMLFLHVFDDFHLQRILADMKQKSWWAKQTKDMDEDQQKLYQHDWLAALIAHSLEWSFMIMLPILVYSWDYFTVKTIILFCMYFIFNTVIHAYVDHWKANKLAINLVIDQSCHIIQIVITWFMWMMLA